MNICMMSELFWPFMLGGAERRYYEIASRLAKKHSVTVYSLRFFGHKNYEIKDGIEIIRVGSQHPLNRRRLPPLATYWPAFFAATRHDHDIIDVNQGVSSLMGFAKPFIKRPVVATFHDIYWNDWNTYFPFPFSSMGKTMEFIWSKLPYTTVIANSPMTAKKLRYVGFRSQVQTIPSGIDSEFINSVKSWKSEQSIVFVGRLVRYKHVDSLVRAFALVQKEYPRAKLKIVGTGPEEDRLKKLAKSMKINAEFYGFVTEEEKIRIIKSSSILVNPSTVEGLGLILVEAMACNVAVVARNLESYFFCDGKNALLYSDDSELGKKLVDIMNDDTRRKNIAENGFLTAKMFSWDNVAAQVESLYKSVV
ncbi:glycosyltransferase family 4 protein [Candidatus Woesearchaeota archaeon]|nr:glycosyltransferase family 4 protein [Candidatus Woesearchaeota archaeon]